MNNKKYGIISLRKQFPNDDVCLEFLFDALHKRECTCGGTYKRIKGRKQFYCSKCLHQIAPTAGTIFHKSDTPLTLWFHAIMVFSNAKSGISAKTIQRDLEITYKCAWRMLHLIRKALKQSEDVLRGDVEMDTGYIGGRAKLDKRMKNKSTVFAAIQRGGEMRAEVMKDGSANSHKNFLWKNVSTQGTRLITDATNKLDNVALGYDRHFVDHHRGEYVRGDIHTNNVETFWSHVKRSIKGTHKVVSKKHLQTYLDGFVFHYNQRRDNDAERFAALLGMLLQPVK